MALDAANRSGRRKAPARKPKPVAGPPTPARLKPSVARGPQGLPGPRKGIRTKSDVQARKRQAYGPQNLPGPNRPVVTPKIVEGRKDVLRQQVKNERKRLGVTTKIELGKDRSLPSLVHELDIARNAKSKRVPVALGLLGHHTKFYDRYSGKPLPSSRNPQHYVIKLATQRVDMQKAAVAAPVLKVLDQTTRPLHAIAGGANAALKHQNVLKAAKRGIENKDKTTFSDVLKTAHAPKVVQSVAGFGLDVVADPTTYVSFGTGGIIKKAAADAAKNAEKKALAQGLTKDQAQRFGRRAAARVVKKAKDKPDARGVHVKFAGREAPGVRRATAKANRGVQKVTPRPVKRAAQRARHVAADFNPNITPDNIGRDKYASIREATRTARSGANRQAHVARLRARAIQKAIGKDNYQRVLDAIEAGKIGSLPENLREPARLLRDHFRHTRRMERRGGIAVGEVKHRKPVPVPEVPSAHVIRSGGRVETVEAHHVTRKELDKAERRHNTAQKELADARENMGRYQGRAEILSREVGGASGEKNAEQVASLRRRSASGETNGRTGSPGDVLKHIAVLERAATHGYQGGGHGAAEAMARLSVAEDAVKRTAKELNAARGTHETTTAAVKTARKARAEAEATNARRAASPKGYVPHVSQERFDAMESGTARRGSAGKTVNPSFAKSSPERKPLATHRASDPTKYVEDPGVLYAGRMAEGARATSRANLNRRLADMGETVRKGRPLSLKDGESVYHVKGSDIRKLDPKKDAAEIQRVVDEGGKNGRYVVLNEQSVDRAMKTVSPSGERTATGEAIDRVQGVWKFLATQPNLGFHVRNAAGGVQNAYLNQPAHRLVKNLSQSWRALGHLNAQEKAYNVIGKAIDPSGKGLVINGEKVSYDKLIKEAEAVGAVRSGFAARELTDLIENKGKIKTGSHFQAIKRLANNIEDVTRLATFIEGRKTGLTAEQASARAARFHFDYSDLTELERVVLRRVMPFYTFSARNIPLQTMSLITRPGKFAQYQKIREEFAKAFGINLDQAESDSTEAKQRSAPIFVKIHGKTVGLSLGPSGLPLTDLSEFPTTANPSAQAKEWMDRAMSMLSPAIKTPVELGYNYSFFFRGQIERDSGPLVPAPSWVGKIPAGIRKDLHIVPDYVDKQTGKKGWGWPGKLAYATQVLPGPFNFANRVMTESDRPGQSVGNKALGYAGLKVDQVDPVSTRITNLYDSRAKVSKAIAALNQRGIYADNPNAEYQRLSGREKALTSQIMALRTKRGDVIHGGRPSSGSSFSPKVDAKLNKLREQNSSRFSPSIEKKLEALRK